MRVLTKPGHNTETLIGIGVGVTGYLLVSSRPWAAVLSASARLSYSEEEKRWRIAGDNDRHNHSFHNCLNLA